MQTKDNQIGNTYDFEKLSGILAEKAREITERGVFVARSWSWDLWEYGGTVYSIPIAGSGGKASVWCSVASLRSHLYHLRQVCGYNALIPPDWENVNTEFLDWLGIA